MPTTDWAKLLRPVSSRWIRVLVTALSTAAAGYCGSFVITPQFTSHTTFIPPQQQQSMAASAIASLSNLAGAATVRSPVEQYISLLQSESVTDRLIDQFDLLHVYDVKFRYRARTKLLSQTTIIAGKKDGLITVSVDDTDAHRAAALANQFVTELRRLTSTLAVSEAQQRRVFFQNQLEETKAKLIAAQTALQQSGFSQGALNTEPQAAASGYARMRGELAAAEVKLEGLRGSLANTSPEVRQQSATVTAIENQLRTLENAAASEQSSPDYVSKYRGFKYEETLFDLMAKQYEIARVDESREGALIQVVDSAKIAEQKSWPRRILFAAGGGLVGLLLISSALILRERRNSRLENVG